jgi:hypothetical protein
MFKRLIVVAATAATLVLASGTTAIATASPGTSVDFGDCANSPDAATVPAGSPITLTDTGSSATGNYGTALHGYKSGVNTVTIAVTGGTTTTFELASAPPRFYGDPYYAWLNVLPDISSTRSPPVEACSSPSTTPTRPAEKSCFRGRGTITRTSAPSTSARETPSKPSV